jgi:hypothetical protein
MVGFEGSRSDGMVQVQRVRALNPSWPALFVREIDLPPREDGQPWKVGDEVGLHGAFWTERNGAKVYAVISEVLNHVAD